MAMSHQAHALRDSRSEDVRRRIFRSHLAYLNQEETPAKLDQRHNLEGLIIQFLSLVPHSEKFHSLDIGDILHRSVNENPKFSAYKATSAFEALEKYATNLISHPWRKEYKILKLYSGFYQHTVRSQLCGTETVFYHLGYQLQEEGELFLDGPVDPDRVARVALDCLTACVECQVMLQICEKVKSFKCSWLEILQVREEYVCGIEGAVRILQLLRRSALDHEKQNRSLKIRENPALKDKQVCSDSNSTQSHQKTGILVDVSNTWPSNVSSHPSCTGDTLLPHSSPHVIPCPPKSGKGVLASHSKSPSWSEGVTASGDRFHQLKNASSKLDQDQLTGLIDDHVKGGHSVMDGSHINSPRYSANSDSLPVNRDESWELLHSPVHKLHYPSSYTFSGFEDETSLMGYTPVPNMKINYADQYAHPFPTHLPLGVPGYPYPIPHNLLFNSRQCQCRMCVEQQQHLILASQLNNKDLTQIHGGPENNVYGRPERHPAEESFDISSALINLSLDGNNPGTKPGQFPLNSSYMIHKTPSNHSRDTATLRPSSSTKLQSSGKRGSYYDNVPSAAETEVVSLTSGLSMVSKSELSANGPVTLNTMSNKPRTQKGITSTDSAGSSMMSRSFQPELLDTESANCVVVQVHKYPNPTLSTDVPKNTKSQSSSMQRNPKEGKRWSCQSCTFYNLAEKRICDMCGRSRFPGPESMPLVSGGRECPQCTLVNRKDCEDCTACGASLKDSPTYI